jgi:hypothetical protein
VSISFTFFDFLSTPLFHFPLSTCLPLAAVIGVAIGVGVSLTLLVLAAALDNVWWPLLMLIPLALLPAPAFLASKGASDDPGYAIPS